MIKKRYLVILGVVIASLGAVTMIQFITDAAAVNEFTIRIQEIHVADIGLLSCDLWVTVNFTNPTNQDLSIASATFNVFIDKNYVGKSSISQVSFPSNSSREQVLSLTLFYSDLANVIVEGIKNRNFDIDVSGDAQVFVLYRLLTISVPFSISSTTS